MKTGVLRRVLLQGMCETTVLKAWVSCYGSVCQSMSPVHSSADCHYHGLISRPFLTYVPKGTLEFLVKAFCQ